MQLNRVFQNLIENAIKFAKPGTPPRVHVASITEGDRIVIRIADDGIGMDDSAKERIFGMFERLDAGSQIAGFGIGLASAKRVVELMGGTLLVESEKGKGSTFIISLLAAEKL